MIITKTVKVVHDASKVSPSALVAALNDAKLQASLGEKGGKTGAGLLLCFRLVQHMGGWDLVDNTDKSPLGTSKMSV